MPRSFSVAWTARRNQFPDASKEFDERISAQLDDLEKGIEQGADRDTLVAKLQKVLPLFQSGVASLLTLAKNAPFMGATAASYAQLRMAVSARDFVLSLVNDEALSGLSEDTKETLREAVNDALDERDYDDIADLTGVWGADTDGNDNDNNDNDNDNNDNDRTTTTTTTTTSGDRTARTRAGTYQAYVLTAVRRLLRESGFDWEDLRRRVQLAINAKLEAAATREEVMDEEQVAGVGAEEAANVVLRFLRSQGVGLETVPFVNGALGDALRAVFRERYSAKISDDTSFAEDLLERDRRSRRIAELKTRKAELEAELRASDPGSGRKKEIQDELVQIGKDLGPLLSQETDEDVERGDERARAANKDDALR